MRPASDPELVDAIYAATREAVRDLFKRYPRDRFYYCSLVTTGEGHAPTLTAWSREALLATARRAGEDDSALEELKWSYADSPFYGYGSGHFAEVRRMFDRRPAPNPTDPASWSREYSARLGAMEAAMARLDSEGVFGVGEDRLRIVINVEVMPPDRTNVERAMRLNPHGALGEWLAEAAEQ